MRFYGSGVITTPVIFLFPGTCCHWKADFDAVIPLLERDFRVMCVSYDGFRKTEDTVSPDMMTTAQRRAGLAGLTYVCFQQGDVGALEKKLRSRGLRPMVVTGHTGWTDDLDFAFAHREKVCSVWFKQKPHDPDAPYDADDESGDTEEKARTVRLQKQKRR